MLLRLAPTPSGFLHEGNRRNFAITAELARELGAPLALRIDDADAARYRREYVEDVFATLRAMEIEWQIGPHDVAEFEAHWSQRHRTDHYRSELIAARAHGLRTYACTCSRRTQIGPAIGGCSAGCRDRAIEWKPGENTLRVQVPRGSMIEVGDALVPLDEAMGDFVLWRRDDLPSYQLVSVVEDRDLRTTHIVRGLDLLTSSAAQIYLAPFVDADNVVQATYVHHDLVTDGEGQKLSKSTMAGPGSVKDGDDR